MKHARRIQTSEMDIRRRLGSTRENAERKARKIQIVVGFDSEDNLRAGYQEHTAKTMNWWDKDLDVMMHVGIGVRELPQNWEDIMFGSSKAQKLSKVNFSNVWQIAKYAAQSGYIAKMHPGYTPKNALRPAEHLIKKALHKIQLRMGSTKASKMGIQQRLEEMKMKSTKASEMAIRQRLMQLDDEISQETAARDMITKVPSMTTKKMKEVLPDLKLSYINLMTLLSLIDSGRNAPEELPKGIGKKELKIAVNEARMIWLWLQSNSIRLGFNFKEYT